MKLFFVCLFVSYLTIVNSKILSHLIQDPRKNSTFYDLILRERVPYGSVTGNIKEILIKKNIMNRQTRIIDYKLIYYSPQLIPSIPTQSQNPVLEPIFSVDSQNGSIYIKTPNEPVLEYLCLKKEFCACMSCIFSLNIIYRTETKINAETVRLFIDDSNDFQPEFYSKTSEFVLTVSESSKIGDEFTLENSMAFDSDAFYNQVSYHLSDTNQNLDKQSNIFEVGRINPERKEITLVLKTHLDHETRKRYDLYLVAKDNGYPSLKSFKKLIVNVLDENDNQPICEKSLFIENIKENLVVKNIVQIRAIDLDSGLNSKLEFVIEPDPDVADNFRIDENGWISLKKSLDYEQRQFWDLKIQVTDSGITRNFTTFCSVRFNVIDVNDNPAKLKIVKYLNESVQRGFFSDNSYPDELDLDNDIEFSLTNKNVKNQIEFYENNPNNLTLGLFRVFDHDTLSNYKFSVQSATSSHEDTSMFEIRQTGLREYELIAIGIFNSEIIQNYRLKIILYDLNEVEKTDLMTQGQIKVNNEDSFRVTLFQRVKILDLNDNKPEFLSKTYEFRVRENEFNETLLSSNPIEVYDLDINEHNSKLRFELKSKNVSIQDYIIINDTVNNYPSLYLIKPFDYETHGDRVELQLIAFDYDDQNDTTYITIKIENVNDNPPVFLNHNSTFKIKENLSIDTFIGQLKVLDKDTPQSDLTFNIITEQYRGVFKIYKTGVLSNSVVLDREVQSFYTLKIEVFDNGSPSLSSTGTFYVEIEDENDNKPSLVYPSEKTRHLNVKLTPSLGEMVRVFDVKAIDNDFNENGKIKYFVQDSENLLQINPENGTVTFNTSNVNITSLEMFKKIIHVNLVLSDNGVPMLKTEHNFTLYLNYDFSELAPEVQKLIQNDKNLDDLKNSNLYKLGTGKYRNFFQIVSNSVLLIILLSVLFFMIFIACFIIVIMFKKVHKKHGNKFNPSESRNFINCFVQVKDVFKDTVNWSKVSNSKTEENLTVKDEASGGAELITVDNFRIIGKGNDPLMLAGNQEILNSESINESNGTNCSEEFSNELNVYSQEFTAYDYLSKTYPSKLVVSDEAKIVQKSNNSYLTTSNNNTPTSTNSLMKVEQDIYQNEFYNYNNQSCFKQSFKCKVTPLNNLSNESMINFSRQSTRGVYSSHTIVTQSADYMDKFEKYYQTQDYPAETTIYKSSEMSS